MMIFIVQCDYFSNFYFGAYSSKEKAEQAIIKFFAPLPNLQFLEHDEADDIFRIGFRNDNRVYLATIRYDYLDEE